MLFRSRMTERKENSFRLSDYSIAEIKTYLLNVLLRDADQMSMQHALEIRLPFLDVELVEYVLGLNDKYKMVNQPKKLLIDALGDLLPETIVNRPKMGFTFPWESWLKNDLREFCEEKLQYLRDVEIINFNQIVKLWTQFKKGDKTVGWSQIWHLVVLANWINKNGVR